MLWEAVNSSKYASVEGLRKKLQLGKRKIPSSSLHVTLYRLVESETLFNAGRGWYSTISAPFKPQYESIRRIVGQVEKQFPQLQFSIWSTEQMQPYAHHIMSRFTIFLYTETDAINSVAEFLQSRKHTVYSNPRKAEVEKYVAGSNRRIIVRPLVTKEPVEGHYATIEKILIDLFLEKDRLFLMDGAEYKRLFENVIFSNRIAMGRLFGYASRRNITAKVAKMCSEYESAIII